MSCLPELWGTMSGKWGMTYPPDALEHHIINIMNRDRFALLQDLCPT